MLAALVLGLIMFVVSLGVQAVPVAILLRVFTGRHAHSLMRPSFPTSLLMLELVALLIVLAHLASIALWAVLYLLCGEFASFEPAFYHSAVNYSSLGYGDIVMSARWRLLGPLEAIDGIVMFGISTALIFALVMRLLERRMQEQEAKEKVSGPFSKGRDEGS